MATFSPISPILYIRFSCFLFFLRRGVQVKIVFNKSVSWVRVRDDHILTVDRTTFIADERFHAYHATENNNGQQQSPMASAASSSSSQSSRQKVGSQTGTSQAASASSSNGPWTLQIRYVQPRDSGIYECQISAEPKISAQVQLHVVGKYLSGSPLSSTSMLICDVRFIFRSSENGAHRRHRSLCERRKSSCATLRCQRCHRSTAVCHLVSRTAADFPRQCTSMEDRNIASIAAQ